MDGSYAPHHEAAMPVLAHLLQDMPEARLKWGSSGAIVAGVSHDTRTLQPGDAFVAIPGFRLDARAFVEEAARKGASAIFADVAPESDGVRSIPFVVVPSGRAALADLSCAFFDHPSRHIHVIGVTGTDGKTTTTQLTSAVLEAGGLRTGWLTTVSTRIGLTVRPNAVDHTTPEAPVIQQTLAEMRAAGVEVAILETSSHALELERVRGTRFEVGVFTNLSPEHVNFHGSVEAYRSAKARLFQALPAAGLAVLNADDPASAAMGAATRASTVTYSLDGTADVRATEIHVGASGTEFRLKLDARAAERSHTGQPLRTALLGRFNVANWLAAFGASRYFGATEAHFEQALAHQGPVPGRMNAIEAGQPFSVVVDFAHTPKALAQALGTLRSLAPGRLLLVFGLAGGRDPASRAAMGRIAAEMTDYFVVSTDDPGDEDPARIARNIIEGAEEAGAREGDGFAVDLDRRSAIERVLARARPGDAVLLAGKGHEQRMVLADGPVPWNDADTVRELLHVRGASRS